MQYLDNYGLRRSIDYFHSYLLHTCKSENYRLHADVFLPDITYKQYVNGIVIEYDGPQHFKPLDFSGTLRRMYKYHASPNKIKAFKKYLKHIYIDTHHRDIKKDKYCKQHNILMIRIEHYNERKHHMAYARRLVKKTLDKKLLPILYQNYLKNVDMNH